MKKIKRILAVIGIILILSMYVLAFVFAFGKSPNTMALFRGALACTIIVPVFLYAFQLVARVVRPVQTPGMDGDKEAHPDQKQQGSQDSPLPLSRSKDQESQK